MAGPDWRAKWPEEILKAFVHEQINHYGFEVTPEESKLGTSTWKKWLWLEKHGFDFAYQSIAAEIFSFRVRQDPSGALPQEERGLMLEIRGVMREILGLEPLGEEQRKLFLATVPLSNLTHWASVRRPYGPADIEPRPDVDFSEVFGFAWNFISEDKPDYIRILREIIRYDDDAPEHFEDHFTINGAYELYIGGGLKTYMLAQVVRYHLRMSADLFISPGNLRLNDALILRFLDYIQAELGG